MLHQMIAAVAHLWDIQFLYTVLFVVGIRELGVVNDRTMILVKCPDLSI